MKVIDLNGLIRLEAEKGNIITTAKPSDLRVSLIYIAANESVDDYIEVSEEPEIELPDNDNIDEPQERLDNISLVEAYHRLLNENAILTKKVEEHERLLNSTIMAIQQMFDINNNKE